jgi:hypothetical protein
MHFLSWTWDTPRCMGPDFASLIQATLATIVPAKINRQRNVTGTHADILIFGTGNFAGRIALDLAATASEPVTVAIAGRNRERLKWLQTAGNARTAVFGRPARVVDRSVADAASDAIAAVARKVVVQAASFQTGTSSAIRAMHGRGWLPKAA